MKKIRCCAFALADDVYLIARSVVEAAAMLPEFSGAMLKVGLYLQSKTCKWMASTSLGDDEVIRLDDTPPKRVHDMVVLGSLILVDSYELSNEDHRTNTRWRGIGPVYFVI